MENTYTESEVKEIIYKTVDKISPLFHQNLKNALSEELYNELRKKKERVFYRVCHEHSLRGLWYDYQGGFTGIIHNEFNFCKNNEMKMDFDIELVGFLQQNRLMIYLNGFQLPIFLNYKKKVGIYINS